MKYFLGTIFLLSSSLTFAGEMYARVISIEPKYETYNEAQCHQEVVRSDNGQVGTVIGAVAGGILGNQVGGGAGKDAATFIGAIVGSQVGNRIGKDQTDQTTKEVCVAVPVRVARGKIVTFDYEGKRFSIHMD